MLSEQSIRGTPIVISAASGTGKTSLCRQLLSTLSHVARSVSYTTRAPRGHEVDGRDYFFVNEATFKGMIAQGAFIEWAEVFENHYGTAYDTIQAQLNAGVDVLLDIDVQGGTQIRRRFEHALLVFLLPPSMEELRRRIVNRGEDSAEIIEYRLNRAKEEIQGSSLYDYWIVNDDFDQAAEELRAVIKSHRLRVNPPVDVLKRLGIRF